MKRRFYFLQDENNGDGNQDGGGGSGNQDDPNKKKDGEPGAQDPNSQDPGDGGKKDGDDPGPGDKEFSPEAQKIIKDLRTENAKRRTDNNNFKTRMEKIEGGLKSMFDDDDESTPEEKLKKVSDDKDQLAVRNSLMSIAIENGIGKDDYEYFEFLMSKRLGKLEEGQELSEEDLDSVLDSIKSRKAGADTSTGDGGGGKPPAGGASEVTQAEFDKMGITAKSLLYQQKPDLYNKLAKNIA